MAKQGVDMVSPFSFDEHLNGVRDEFLDNFIESDFPMEDCEGNIDWDARFRLLELPSPDDLNVLSTSSSGKLGNDNSGSLRSSSEKEVKPKLKDSSSLGNSETISDSNIFHRKNVFEGKDSSSCFYATTGCVSVLESGSSSFSGDNSLHLGYRFLIPVKRARSKRLRPPTLNPKLTVPFTSCLEKRKAKRKNLSVPSSNDVDPPELDLSGSRKCTHCEVTKTPQWREGPMGPKTLCNACGVRYRSGRLFPEYCPAASPKFVAAVHSNSHKKVVEMRKKGATSSVEEASQFGNNSNGCLSV